MLYKICRFDPIPSGGYRMSRPYRVGTLRAAETFARSQLPQPEELGLGDTAPQPYYAVFDATGKIVIAYHTLRT